MTKAVEFQGKRYAPEPYVGMPSATAVLKAMSATELVELYNLVSSNMGGSRVNRFESIEKGLKRTWKKLQEYAATDAPDGGEVDTAAETAAATEVAKPAKAKRTKADTEPKAPRVNKTNIMVELMQRKEGATIDEMVKATDWQKHSVRGAIAGQIKKKLNFEVDSAVEEGRGRVYRIAS